MEFASTYKVEPELSLYAHRQVRLSADALLGRWLVVGLWLLINSLCGFYFLTEVSELRALQREGQTLHTPILDKRIEKGKTTHYYLDYAFTVDDVTFSDSQEVSEQTYDRVHRRQLLLVTYLPGRPQVHRIGVVNEARIHARKTDWALVCIIVTAFLGLLWMLIETEFHRQLRLARSGMPVPGLILSCKPPEPNTKETNYKITYTFISPMGRERSGSAQISPDIGKQLRPKMTVTVLCDRDRTERYALYLSLSQVRVEGAAGFTLAVETGQ